MPIKRVKMSLLTTFLQPSPGSHSAGQSLSHPIRWVLLLSLKNTNLGVKSKLTKSNQHPHTPVFRLVLLILIKAACLIWEIHLMDQLWAPCWSTGLCRHLKKLSAVFPQGSRHKIMDTPGNLWVLQSQKFCVRNHETETSLYRALRKELPRKAGR